MYDVLTVADAILKIAKSRGKRLTPMQIVKLAYIAYGWYLALADKQLFNNRIEAWQYGPVIPDLYHATKSYGRRPIPFEDIGPEDDIELDAEDHAFLSSVVDKYGHMDGIALSYMTHKAGTPWTQVYSPYVRGAEIPNDLIEAHYKQLMESAA